MELLEVFNYEIAYSKEDFRKEAKDDLNKAEELIENLSGEIVFKDIREEWKGMGFTKEEIEAMGIILEGFQEFDSPRWHGSGYFWYRVYVTTEAMVKEIKKKFKKWEG